MSSAIFRFKKFEINQQGCAMKINTDGVLLGAIAGNTNNERILDIGTGTGLIALMLAQRFADARIQALEIDGIAAQRAGENFIRSPFGSRLESFHTDFKDFIPDEPYDLIVSNPPYFVNSLKNADDRKALARHSDIHFFDELLRYAHIWLKPEGMLALILPLDVRDMLTDALSTYQDLNVQKDMLIRSFPETPNFRTLLHISKNAKDKQVITEELTLYERQHTHSKKYMALLREFFLAF